MRKIKIFGVIVTYILIVVEAIFMAKYFCDPGIETYIYIGLSCLFGIIAVALVSDCENIFSFIGKMLLALVIIPMMVIVIMFIVELFMWLIKTFTIKGVVGIGTIVGIIIAIIGSCTFIFFF